jgi:hypothetical protein
MAKRLPQTTRYLLDRRALNDKVTRNGPKKEISAQQVHRGALHFRAIRTTIRQARGNASIINGAILSDKTASEKAPIAFVTGRLPPGKESIFVMVARLR